MYSCDIHFYRKDLDVACDVITCVAPNYSAAKRQGVSKEENNQVLQSRIQYILDMASLHHVDTLILGVFSCGVFKQNPQEVAKIIKTLLKKYAFETVIFAILDVHSENYRGFEKSVSLIMKPS